MTLSPQEYECFALQHKVMSSALNVIASWSEGREVDDAFDEPNSAKVARETLRLLQIPIDREVDATESVYKFIKEHNLTRN